MFAVAVIVSLSAVDDAWIATKHVPMAGPDEAVTQVVPLGKLTSPLGPAVPKVTVTPPRRVPAPSVTVAVADDGDDPSAGTEDGTKPTAVRGVAPAVVEVSVRGELPWTPFLVAVAVMVSVSGVSEAWTVTEQVPSVPVVQPDPPGKVTSPSVVKATTAPGTGLWLTSLTVAVAVEVVVPSAGSELGLIATATEAGGTAVSVRVAVPVWPLAAALMVSLPVVVEAVMVIEQVPSPGPEDAVVQVAPLGKVTSPLLVKVTGAPGTRLLVASLTVTVA